MVSKAEKNVREAARSAVQDGLKGSGLTLRQAARHWQIPESTLCRINNGKLPSAAVAVKIFVTSENNLLAAEEDRRSREEPAKAIARILKSVAKRDRFKVYTQAGRMVA